MSQHRAPGTEGILSPLTETSGYKRSLQIITDDSDLKTVFTKVLATKDTALHLVPENSFSEFRLILSAQVAQVRSLETKPRLFGYLQKDTTPVEVTYAYSLEKNTGHTLDTGSINIVTEAQTTIYPQLKKTIQMPEKEVNNMVNRILKNAQKAISLTPWSAEVIAQKDTQHVIMSGSASLGLNIADKFITKTQPISTLELVTFEENAKGYKQPLLRLLSGPLPTTGKSLAPFIESEAATTKIRMPAQPSY